VSGTRPIAVHFPKEVWRQLKRIALEEQNHLLLFENKKGTAWGCRWGYAATLSKVARQGNREQGRAYLKGV
jgi:hypothetical protein